jgi:hypothetical protein
MEEYITETVSASKKQTLKRCCCSYLWKTARSDLRTCVRRDCLGMFFNIITAIWMITNFALFCAAKTTGDETIWYANGIISSLIPFILGVIFIVVTVLLYLRKAYVDTETKLFKEMNPHLTESWRLEDPIIFDPADLTASKIIHV